MKMGLEESDAILKKARGELKSKVRRAKREWMK